MQDYKFYASKRDVDLKYLKIGLRKYEWVKLRCILKTESKNNQYKKLIRENLKKLN